MPEELRRLEFAGFSNIKESLRNVTRTIDNLEYKIISEYYKDGMQLQTGEYLKVAGVQEDKLYVKRRGSSSQLQQYAGVTDDMNLNGILFAPDIKKWEEIKNMQYGHYCTDLLIFIQIILVITVVLMYNKRNGGDSYGKTKKVQYPSYGK